MFCKKTYLSQDLNKKCVKHSEEKEQIGKILNDFRDIFKNHDFFWKNLKKSLKRKIVRNQKKNTFVIFFRVFHRNALKNFQKGREILSSVLDIPKTHGFF